MKKEEKAVILIKVKYGDIVSLLHVSLMNTSNVSPACMYLLHSPDENVHPNIVGLQNSHLGIIKITTSNEFGRESSSFPVNRLKFHLILIFINKLTLKNCCIYNHKHGYFVSVIMK